MELLKKLFQIFKKPPPDQELDILFPGELSAKRFIAFNPDQRMQAVMIVGDSGEVKFYHFLKWCVEEDSDLGVRLAALKRLPNYLEQADLTTFLTRLDKSADKLKLEPYLSMALSQVGLITSDELNTRINGG